MAETNKSSLKEEVSKIAGGTLKIANEGVDVAEEGIELWASIKTLNIIGIVKNGYEFLTEVTDLLTETVKAFKAAGPIFENIKNDIVNSEDLKNINKELGDLSKELGELKDAFEKKGIFAAIPELLDLFKEVGESLDAALKGVGDLVSEVGNGIVDGISNTTVDPQVKESADKVKDVIESAQEIVTNSIEAVKIAENAIKKELDLLQGFGKSVTGGVSDIDKAKSGINNSKSQNDVQTVP